MVVGIESEEWIQDYFEINANCLYKVCLDKVFFVCLTECLVALLAKI